MSYANFKFINYPDVEETSDDLYRFVQEKTSILEKKLFWNKVNVSGIYQYVPRILKFFTKLKFYPLRCSFLYIDRDSAAESHIHVDSVDESKTVRVLFPVYGCAGSKTKFYQIDRSKLFSTQLSNGIPFYDYPREAEYTLLNEVELVKPILFDASVAHSVHINQNFPGPRITFTILFFQDLKKYLHNDFNDPSSKWI